MLVIVWHLLSGNGVYRGHKVEMVARTFQEWDWTVEEKDRYGGKKDFILERLEHIEIDDLTRFKRGEVRMFTISPRALEVPCVIRGCGREASNGP